MRLLLVFAALALLPSCSSAWAGETFIGRIYVSDGGSVNNATTGYGSAGCARQTDPGGAGACDQAFPIGVGTKLTVQAVEACCVSVNRASTDAGLCMLLAAAEKFPTSVSSSQVSVGPLNVLQSDGGVVFANAGGLPDGGSYLGAVLSITPPAGASSCHLNVFTRSGTE